MASGRGHFTGRFAAVMAMAGSAIGLGNIWRFPYMVGQNGGAAFVLVYLLAALLLCVPIFVAESVIGKKTQLSTFGAMDTLAPGTKWKWMGLLTVLTPLVILSFYSVVGGWSIDYLGRSLALAFSDPSVGQAEHSAKFGAFISSPWKPLVFHTAFILINVVVVMAGVRKGIEFFTKYTTPVLFVLIVAIMVYSLSLPGSSAGVEYLVKPDFSKLTSSTVLAAMGQAFFSLSLGVGCVLTYSSYLKKDENLLATGSLTVIFDLMFALIAGFAIMPAVFAAGIEPGAGPGLIFETLPYIFSQMGAHSLFLSAAVAILFFVTILFAALTSSVSMLEVGVSFLVDQKGMSRRRATVLLGVCCWALGLLCSLSFGPLSSVSILGLSIFDFCDALTSNFLMTFGSLLFVLFVGWVMDKQSVRDEFTASGKLKVNDRIFNVLYVFIRYVAPVAIMVIFVSNLIS